MQEKGRNLLALADGDNPLDDPIALFIVQLVFILVVSRALGYLFKFIKQPQVIAEVITGIILGPTVLGEIPGYMSNLFSKDSIAVVNVFANIGLIFFMFLIGVELDPGLLKRNAKSASIIAFASMAAPFGIGALVSILLYDMFADHSVKFSTFLLFCGVAMSITAFPVLARILTETRLTGAKVGLIALSAAAVNDVVAWILLAVVVSIAKAKSPLSTVWTLLIMVGFFILMAFGVRPLLNKVNNKAQDSAAARHQMVMLTFALVLASAWFTEVIGIHAIFGGFVMGVISPRDHGWPIYITERIEDVIIILLLPLYFTVSGLNTNLRDLNDGKAWGICFLVISLACFGKIVGSMVAAKMLGNTFRESLTVGILMNTKGLVELIVLNLGLQVGVLTPELFAIFVMMAVITTMTTSPLLHFIWIRNQKRKAVPLIHDSFSVMMCISNQVTGLAMASIAATLAIQKKKKFSLQALHVTEVTDSPSSYFFAHRRMPPPHFLELVKERTRALSIPLKIKQLFAVNVADDIEYYFNTKNFDLVLIGWNEPIIERGGHKLKQVLAHTSATVGVVVNRGVDEIVQIHKVLAMYCGHPHEKDALKLARLMCRKMGVLVTLISSVQAIELGIENEPINFIYNENPMQAGIEESREKYDLVIVGIARHWSMYEIAVSQTTELLHVCPASILLVHPKIEDEAKRKKHLTGEDEEDSKIFWGDQKTLTLKNRNKSTDFDTLPEAESTNPSPKQELRKSKSKLRVDTSFELEPINREDLHLHEYKHEDKILLRSDDEVHRNSEDEDNRSSNGDEEGHQSHSNELHRRSLADLEPMRRSGDEIRKRNQTEINLQKREQEAQRRNELTSSASIRMSKSHDSFHAIEVQVPAIPPPPNPITPRASNSGGGAALRSPLAGEPSQPRGSPQARRSDEYEDDLVFVD